MQNRYQVRCNMPSGFIKLIPRDPFPREDPRDMLVDTPDTPTSCHEDAIRGNGSRGSPALFRRFTDANVGLYGNRFR